MRIIYFYQYFSTPKGAWSTRAYEFSRRWVSAGDSVTIITSVYDKSDLAPTKWLSRLSIDGIDVRTIGIGLSNRHSVARRLYSFFVYALVSCWYGLTLPADVVVASSGPISAALPGLVARYFRRRPFVLEVRDLWPEGAIQLGILRDRVSIALARWFEKRCYSAAVRIVALSEGAADWIRTSHGLSNVKVVPNASDNELFDQIKDSLDLPCWAKSKWLVLYAGSIGLMDDCGQLVSAASAMQRRGEANFEFVIIGEGGERVYLEERAKELKLDHVHFLGPMSKETVMSWLREARCAILTYKDVPVLATVSPNKLFDALAAGLPVVQCTQGWIKRLLESEKCGLTVPPNDPEAMADAILELAANEGLRKAKGVNAKRIALEKFDRHLLAHEMRRILASAVKEST